MPMPYYPPQKDDSSKTIIIIVVIVIALIIIIPIILAAVLFFMVSDMIDIPSTTPHGVMDFSESEPGVYEGHFVVITGIVDLSDASMTITDDSIGSSATLNPLVDEGTAQVFGGMGCTFNDVDGDDGWGWWR